MGIIPLSGRILITEVSKNETTESGLILSGKDESVIKRGKVVALSKYHKVAINEGDTIIFNKQTAADVGDDLLIIHETEIIAIVK